MDHESGLFEILQLRPGPSAGSLGSQRLLDGDSRPDLGPGETNVHSEGGEMTFRSSPPPSLLCLSQAIPLWRLMVSLPENSDPAWNPSNFEIIEAKPLPPGTSAQLAELIALTRALEMGKGKK